MAILPLFKISNTLRNTRQLIKPFNMKKVLFAGIACIYMGISLVSKAQSFSVNTDGSTADASALLDVKSTSKGVLIPRMNKTERNAIASPATGLLVFQTGPDSIGFHYYYGGTWLWLPNSKQNDSTYWNTHGNSGLDTTSFFGYTDNTPITFKINGQKVGRFEPAKFNYFIGQNAGSYNSGSFGHVAIGDQAGSNLNTNNPGIFIGSLAGTANTTGRNCVIIGPSAGFFNTTGDFNVFLGALSGIQNTTGQGNTFLGHGAATTHKVNSFNVAVGYTALSSDSSGSSNTALGYNSDVGSNNLTNATAIGARAQVGQSNSMVLGSINGVNGATATVNVGIGETTPNARLHIRRNGSSGGSFLSTSSMIIEDNASSYFQFSNPSNNETGFVSGNAETTIRSAFIFRADSSLQLRTGGNNTRITIDNTGLTGVRTTTPLSYHDVNGSTGNAISVSAANQTLDEFDHTHVITNAAGAITITLPAANTCSRREYVIVNQSGSAKTITSYLDFTGAANTTAPANNSITLQSNGTNWYRIK